MPQARIAVNSRCGHACVFCRPSGEATPTRAGEMLDLKSVLDICRSFQEQGVEDFKLTGGDPALWPHLVECVHALKNNLGIRTLEVISRHPRIGAFADELFQAGLDKVNISLDTLDAALHRKLTGVDDLEQILQAIRSCVRSGLKCKINTVLMLGVNDSAVPSLIEFCELEGISQLKLLDVIRDLGNGTETHSSKLVNIGATTLPDLYTDMAVVTRYIETRAVSTSTKHQGGLGHPLKAYVLDSGLEILVKDHRLGAWYSSICEACRFFPCHDALMAVRVTAAHQLQYCLLREDLNVPLDDFVLSSPTMLGEVVTSSLKVYRAATFCSKNGSDHPGWGTTVETSDEQRILV